MEWFQARLRWAEMADDEGLRGWRESTVLLRSRDEEDAFEQAPRFGRRREGGREEGDRFVGLRLAEVVTLDRIGAVLPDVFEVAVEQRAPTAPLPDDHIFAPELRRPVASF